MRIALGLTSFLLLTFAGMGSQIFSSPQASSTSSLPVRQVYAPYRQGGIVWAETAISWFGRVNSTDNYVDARIAYNDEILLVHLIIFDRQLWYDRTPERSTLTEWDAAEVFLTTEAMPPQFLGSNTYRFVTQLYHWQSPDAYRAAFVGNGDAWIDANLTYTATTGHRAGEINGPGDDRGWLATFRIPFASLGLDGPPPQATSWRLGIQVHDRDTEAAPVAFTPKWPETMDSEDPSTWGELIFGLPRYEPPSTEPTGQVLIRQGLNGVRVIDAQVGGDTVCGGTLDYWTQWGDANYAGSPHLNIQNQNDVADWPCFSKAYITFPLDSIPPNKAILSATVTLHLFGNANGQQAKPSWIQVLTIDEDWKEETITWNNAPLARKNIGGTWVNPVTEFPGWPGIPWEWDVSLAVAEAYSKGQPLRLAFYSADTAYHSGKYFVSSDTGDWNEEARPTLRIVWGESPTPLPTSPSPPPWIPEHHLFLPLVKGQ